MKNAINRVNIYIYIYNKTMQTKKAWDYKAIYIYIYIYEIHGV